MKLTKFFDEEIETKQASKKHKEDHYQKNLKSVLNTQTLSQEEINKKATELSLKPVDYKNILGYVSEDSSTKKYIKYNSSTNECVIYTYTEGFPKVIKYFVSDYRTFNSDKSILYSDEIERGM